MKDTFYFPHDSNAQNDPKLIMVMEQMGPEGIGIFWMLLEVLREQTGYRYPLATVPALARRWNSTKEKVMTVITQYGLFQVQENEFFYSEPFCRRMEFIDKKRLSLSEAGRRGNEKRWNKALPSSTITDAEEIATRSPGDRHPIASKGKERKGNKSKVNESKGKREYAPSLFLSEEEFEKLKARAGEKLATEAIEQVSLHKQATGKKYKSDYAAILKWGIDAALTKKNNNGAVKAERDYDELARRIGLNSAGQ